MGAMDKYTRLYLQKNAIFADFMNAALFQGRDIVHPEDLHEMNSAMDLVLEEKKDGKLITLSLIRDILKFCVADISAYLANAYQRIYRIYQKA